MRCVNFDPFCGQLLLQTFADSAAAAACTAALAYDLQLLIVIDHVHCLRSRAVPSIECGKRFLARPAFLGLLAFSSWPASGLCYEYAQTRYLTDPGGIAGRARSALRSESNAVLGRSLRSLRSVVHLTSLPCGCAEI